MYIIKRTATYGKRQSMYLQDITGIFCIWTTKKNEAYPFKDMKAARSALRMQQFKNNKYAKHTIITIKPEKNEKEKFYVPGTSSYLH